MRNGGSHWTGVFLLSALAAFPAQGQSTEKIVVDGSTGVLPLAAALGQAFQLRNAGLAVESGKGLGTKARIQALAEGKIDVALASHGLDVTAITRQGMAVREVARIAVVFGVNTTVPVTDITDRQLCDIYAGNTTNWSALGAAPLEIMARTRPDTEVDTEVVRANIRCLADLKMPESIKTMPRSGDMAKELAATSGAIGMTTMTVIEQSAGKIRALSLNGIVASAGNVERKSYPLVRESYFVTKVPSSPPVARFLDFVQSPEGERVIRANGGIPLR